MGNCIVLNGYVIRSAIYIDSECRPVSGYISSTGRVADSVQDDIIADCALRVFLHPKHRIGINAATIIFY